MRQKLRNSSLDAMFFAVSFFCIFLNSRGTCDDSVNDLRGPSFRNEPSSRVAFSNTAGTELRCVVEGHPPPRVHWYTREGKMAEDVPGLRYQRLHMKDSSGTLVFPPFSRPEYQQEIHDAVYQCVATNDFGTAISREVHVKAVVKQRFNPQVYDEFVTRGNTAVLRCHLPSFAKDHVLVDAWIRNDGQILKASTEDLTRVRSTHVLRSGELLIHDVADKESSWKFRCQTRHKLTGELVVSETEGKIIVTEQHSSTLPNFIFKGTQVRAEEGMPTELPCVAQGSPPPTYRWVKEVSGVLVPVEERDGRGGLYIKRGVLTIGRVQRSDSGQYQCIARNSIGERRVDTSLLVSAPLSVTVRPHRLELTLGQEATLSCNVSGYPLHHVTWIKDREAVDPLRVRQITKQVLHIPAVRRQDKGIYQCFAINDRDSAQGEAQLHIADAPPILISVFLERAVEPGDRVSMKCVASGNPVPTISWYLDDDLITRTRPRMALNDYVTEPEGHVVSYLNVTESRLEDGGEYSCQASNEVGFTMHGERLSVRGPPFVRPMKNATAISRKALLLRCPYGGHPIKSIQWLKDDAHLPADMRPKSNTTGILKIESVEREIHEGSYTCIVIHADGQTASGSAFVTVVVSPVIEASHLRDTITVNEKSRTKLMCVVNEGDPPLLFRWFKNGQPFLAHGDTTVQTFEDTSMVTFKKVASVDRGLYTCVVSNKAASANRTTELVVNVPPQWSVEPQNSTAVVGMKAWLDCAATGHPVPNTIWKKIIHAESGAEDFSWMRSSPRIHRFNNGTLTLTEVDEADAGAYLCQANNGIGTSMSKIIFLKVYVPPHFKEDFQKKKIAVEGKDALISCTAEGDPPIEIVWKKDNKEISTSLHARYNIRKTMGDKETSSELLLRRASREEDTGTFTCVATSAFGSDETSKELVVQGVPEPPIEVTVTNVTSRSATLKWEVSHDGNAHRTGSIIQYKAESDSSWTGGQASELIVSGSDNSATLRALSPIATYFARVVAENSLGRSQPSEVVNLTTSEEAPSGAPRDVAVQSTGAQSMKVTWKAPPEETRNGRIRGHYVGYRQSAFSDPYHFQKVDAATDDKSDNQISTYITGLKPFTQYDIVVRSFNSAGSGPKSSRIVGRTLETAPPTSPTVQVSSTTTSQVEISWEKNSRDKSAITEYTLHYKSEGDVDWSRERISGDLERYMLSDLKCGTRYSLYITASNSLGTGEPSTPVTARTKGAAPMSPKMEHFLKPNSTFTLLSMEAWQSMGCPIQSFSIHYRPKQKDQHTKTGEQSFDAGRTTYVLQPLAPGREYVLLVTAHSEAGATQGEYHFRTLDFNASNGPSSYPTYGVHPDKDRQQPIYRNVALVIPVVVSSLVLVIVAFAVAICLRKQAQDRRERLDYGSQQRKPPSDSLMMREINSKKTVYTPSPKSSHYAIPAVKKADYAEPYVCDGSGRQGDGLFATIKRGPSRPLHVAAQHKTGDNTT